MHMGMANVHHQSGRKDLSAQALQSAAASDPQWWEPPLYLGHLLIEAGQLTAAIRAYATAVALLPQRSIYAARAYNNMGLAYKRTGDSAASEESYLNSITYIYYIHISLYHATVKHLRLRVYVFTV